MPPQACAAGRDVPERGDDRLNFQVCCGDDEEAHAFCATGYFLLLSDNQRKAAPKSMTGARNSCGVIM